MSGPGSYHNYLVSEQDECDRYRTLSVCQDCGGSWDSKTGETVSAGDGWCLEAASREEE